MNLDVCDYATNFKEGDLWPSYKISLNFNTMVALTITWTRMWNDFAPILHVLFVQQLFKSYLFEEACRFICVNILVAFIICLTERKSRKKNKKHMRFTKIRPTHTHSECSFFFSFISMCMHNWIDFHVNLLAYCWLVCCVLCRTFCTPNHFFSSTTNSFEQSKHYGVDK